VVNPGVRPLSGTRTRAKYGTTTVVSAEDENSAAELLPTHSATAEPDELEQTAPIWNDTNHFPPLITMIFRRGIGSKFASPGPAWAALRWTHGGLIDEGEMTYITTAPLVPGWISNYKYRLAVLATKCPSMSS